MRASLLIASALAAAVWIQQPETLSLLEEPLYAPHLAKADRARLEARLADARAAWTKNPDSVDLGIDLAGAQRALGRIGDALETLTRTLERKDDPRLHVELGRGFIVIRKFELAEKELQKGAAAAPDAHCDIAFALYLRGEFSRARDEYGRCAQAGFFGYLAAWRAGAKPAGPPPSPPSDRDIASAALRLPGSVATRPERQQTTIGAAYLDAMEKLTAGDHAKARDLLKGVVEKNKNAWMEALYIAAEADYARILKADPKHKRKKKQP